MQNDEIQELRRRVEEMEMESRASDVSRSSQNHRILDLERDLVRARIPGDECAELKRRIKELEQLASTSMREKQLLEQQHLQGIRLSELEAQLISASTRKHEYVEENSAKRDHILQLEQSHGTHLAELETHLQGASSRENKYVSENSAQRDRIWQLEELLATAQTDAGKVARLEEQSSHFFYAVKDDLEHQLAESRAINEMYAHEISEQQQSVSGVMEQLSIFRATKDEIDKKHQVLLSQVSGLEQERDDACDLEKTLAERNGSLRQQLAHLEHQADTLEHVQGVHVQECKRYQSQIVELESELVESQSSLQRLGVQHDHQVEHGVALERELAGAHKAEERIGHQSNVHHERILELERKLMEVADLEEARAETKEHQAEISDYEQRNDALSQHVAELESELRRMRPYEKSFQMHVRKTSDLEESLKLARETEQRLRRQDMTHKAQIRKLESTLSMPNVKMAVISSMHDDGDDMLGGADGPPLQLFPSLPQS